MELSDDRGQALQVGAILLFGILIVGLALYQGTVVPDQNERVEYETYLQASNDVTQLDNQINRAAAQDYPTRTQVRTGVSYPTRLVTVNPGPPGNRLRTGEVRPIQITNARAVSGEENNTRTYWNGTPRNYSTASIQFDTDYNQLQAPPIVYESSTLYRPSDQTNEAPYESDQVFLMSNGELIDRNRITLVTIHGSLDAGGMQPTVVARPVSAHTRTVIVTGDDSEGEPTLTVPSRLSNETWEEDIIDTEINNGNVLRVVPTPDKNNSVDVVLNGSRNFELYLAKVEIRRSTDSSQVTPTAPQYVIVAAGDGQSLSRNQQTRVTAEVRDHYNNPKSGVSVQFSTSDGTFVQTGSSTETITTDGEGRASVQFTPNTTGETTVNATINGSTSDLNTTQFLISVSSGSDNGAGNGDDDLPGGEPVVGNPDMAFDDANDNGNLDNGERTFEKDELYNFDNDSVNLVIPEAVGKLQQPNSQISIQARSITTGVDIRSQNSDVELTATEGEILISGEIRSNNEQVEIYGKRIDISGATIRADNGDITISATESGGGELDASGSDTLIRSQNNDIILESIGDMYLDDARIRSQNGEISADLGGDYTIHISETTVENQDGPGAIMYTPAGVTEDPERPIAEPQ